MRNMRNKNKRIKHMNLFTFRVPFLGCQVPYILRGLSPTFIVLDPGSHPWDGSCILGVGPNFRVPSLGSWVSPMRWLPGLRSQVPNLGYRVSPMRWVPDLGSQVPSSEFRVLGLGSHLRDGSHVSGPTNSFGFQVPFFGYAIYYVSYVRCKKSMQK